MTGILGTDSQTDPMPAFIGVSAAVQRALALAERFAATNLPILIVGPTGTGKELLAQRIHQRSGRRGELVDVNCGALPRDMTESLLFGHRRGAFTGAVESVSGLIEQSRGGTLLLDELLSLPFESQAKLLRVLENGEVRPLGDRKRIVDLRIVATAQSEISARVGEGGFRRDLYQRIAGVVINLPALADRREDVVPLAAHFAAETGRTLGPGAHAVLLNHVWRGNARELRMAVERAAHLVDNGQVCAAALAEAIELGAPSLSEPPSIPVAEHWQLERGRLLTLCEQHGWRAARIARAMGIARSTLFRRLKASGVSLHAARRSAALLGSGRPSSPRD